MTLRPLARKLRSSLATWSRTVVLGGLALGGGAWLAQAAMFRVWPAVVDHPYFRLTSIHVRCDNDALPPEAIAAKAGSMPARASGGSTSRRRKQLSRSPTGSRTRLCAVTFRLACRWR